MKTFRTRTIEEFLLEIKELTARFHTSQIDARFF